MTAVYSVVYFDDDSLLAQGIDDASAYDVLLWCAPDIPWTEDDGMRDGSDHRERADKVIAARVAPALALDRIAGASHDRMAAALRAIARRSA
jgi:nicotinamide riboside kinase